jgi:hypothetical protein
MATSAPALAKTVAISAPIPLDAPVISARFPSRVNQLVESVHEQNLDLQKNALKRVVACNGAEEVRRLETSPGTSQVDSL